MNVLFFSTTYFFLLPHFFLYSTQVTPDIASYLDSLQYYLRQNIVQQIAIVPKYTSLTTVFRDNVDSIEVPSADIFLYNKVIYYGVLSTGLFFGKNIYKKDCKLEPYLIDSVLLRSSVGPKAEVLRP